MTHRLLSLLTAMACAVAAFGIAGAVTYHKNDLAWGVASLIVSAVVFQWLVFDRAANRAERRRRRGLCAACGYDLTGNVSGVCPECGVAR